MAVNLEFENKLWEMADKLRGNIQPSDYKDIILVDWAIRDSVQAKMKMTIKRLLKKYGYPPDKTAKAVDIVMEQTKLMCQNESM